MNYFVILKLNLIEIRLVLINDVKNALIQCLNANFVIILQFVYNANLLTLIKIFYLLLIILVLRLVQVYSYIIFCFVRKKVVLIYKNKKFLNDDKNKIKADEYGDVNS